MRKALQQISDQYDFCVVDNAPDINISVINALTAANDVLIPVEVDDNTLEGMKELLEQIEEVKEELNPELQNVKCFTGSYSPKIQYIIFARFVSFCMRCLPA